MESGQFIVHKTLTTAAKRQINAGHCPVLSSSHPWSDSSQSCTIYSTALSMLEGVQGLRGASLHTGPSQRGK